MKNNKQTIENAISLLEGKIEHTSKNCSLRDPFKNKDNCIACNIVVKLYELKNEIEEPFTIRPIKGFPKGELTMICGGGKDIKYDNSLFVKLTQRKPI